MGPDSALLRGLRLVASMVKLHPGPFVVALIGAIVYAGATVVTTIVLGRVTDDIVLPTLDGTSDPDRSVVWGGVIAVVAVTVLRASGVVARRYFAGMTSERIQRSFRDRLADQYLALPLSWHRQVPTGQLLAHADADARTAVEVLHPLPFTLGVSFLAAFSAVSVVLVDPFLALIGLLVFPAVTTLNRWYSRLVEPPAARAQAELGAVSAVAHESFDGALIVKTLGRADDESVRFRDAVQRLRSERVHVGVLRSAFDSVLNTVPYMSIVLVAIVGVYRLEDGAMTVGQLVQVVALFSVLAFPMTVFGFFLESLPPSVVAHDRISQVLEHTVPEPPTARLARPAGPARIEAVGIGFAFSDGTEVLRSIDLAIEPGQTVAIVGSTGSGKSTLAYVLSGLILPSSGTVLLDGVPFPDLDPGERTRNVSLVFQEPFLFGDTVRANIDVDDTAAADDVRAAARIARIDDFVVQLPDGYDTVIGERGTTISGGQRQRVALARALVRQPRLLVLDDATSAVDPRVEQMILDRLRDDLDTTMVMVAQRLSTIELADRVVYLRDGVVAADGTHEELLALDGYSSLVTAYEQAAR